MRLDDPLDGDAHALVVHPTTTTLWASCERLDASAPCRVEALGQAEADPPHAEVPLEHGNLRQVARDLGDDLAVAGAGSAVNAWVTIWPGTIPITRAVRSSPSSQTIREASSASGANRIVWRTQSGTAGRGISPTEASCLEDHVQYGSLQVGEDQHVQPDSRGASARWSRPCHRAGLKEPSTIASSGVSPSRTASRTRAFMWPSSAMCSAVVRAERDPVGTVLLDKRGGAARLRAADASRISSHMPARSRSRLPRGGRLVVGADTGGSVGLQRHAPGRRGRARRRGRHPRCGAWPARPDRPRSRRVVHHLRQAHHPAAAEQALEVPGTSGRRGTRTARRGRMTRR